MTPVCCCVCNKFLTVAKISTSPASHSVYRLHKYLSSWICSLNCTVICSCTNECICITLDQTGNVFFAGGCSGQADLCIQWIFCFVQNNVVCGVHWLPNGIATISCKALDALDLQSGSCAIWTSGRIQFNTMSCAQHAAVKWHRQMPRPRPSCKCWPTLPFTEFRVCSPTGTRSWLNQIIHGTLLVVANAVVAFHICKVMQSE